MGPRLTVPCPYCGAVTPAGLSRHMILLAVVGRPVRRKHSAVIHRLTSNPGIHRVTRSTSNVYYERRCVTQPDDS